MPTTITVSEKTRKRLAAYKRGGSTYDDLLNRLMDEVDLGDVMAEDLAEHHRVLNDPNTEWVDGLEVARWLKGERKTFPPVIRRGKSYGVSRGDEKASPEAAGSGPAGVSRKVRARVAGAGRRSKAKPSRS